MAGSVVTYYRNYNSSDDTLLRRANASILSPEALGFSPPEGMLFDSWNTQRDGSGTTKHAGDSYVEQTPVLYAIWAVDADVVVSYNGSVIASLDASGTKTLLTSGKYCEDDITIDYTAPSGGGGGSSDFETHTVTITADTDVQLYLPSILDENGWPPNSINCFAYLPANTPKTYTLVFYKGRCYTGLDNSMWDMTGVVDYDYDCDRWYFTGDGSVSMEYD